MTDADPMPVFVIKGKDALALPTLRRYRALCLRNRLIIQADQVTRAIREMQAWQERHPGVVKLPDHTHVPASTPPATPTPPTEE